MSITQTQCAVFKSNLLQGLEDFSATTSQTYKIALYNANADLGAGTLVYTAVNEVTGTGYTAGGELLTPIPPTYDITTNTAYWSFDTVNWTSASFTCRGALIYNSGTNAAVAVLNFGSDKTTTGTFTITFPTNGATTSVLRIS